MRNDLMARTALLASFALALIGVHTYSLAATDLALEVTHQSSSLGADGIKRDTLFTERVIRQGDTVWIERVIPAGAHTESELEKAKNPKGHKHADLNNAVRWIQKLPDGKLKLRLVALHDKVIVDVAPNEFANVGFDGSWAAAYHLIDPAFLKKLKPAQTEGASQWFFSAPSSSSNSVRILWTQKNEIPTSVLTQNVSGTTKRLTTVRVLSHSPSTPWRNLNQFVVKEYSDFLD
jgi:hypothetical protein